MNLKGVGNVVGLFTGLALVAVIAAKPDFLKVTFSGFNSLLGTAISPVTTKPK